MRTSHQKITRNCVWEINLYFHQQMRDDIEGDNKLFCIIIRYMLWNNLINAINPLSIACDRLHSTCLIHRFDRIQGIDWVFIIIINATSCGVLIKGIKSAVAANSRENCNFLIQIDPILMLMSRHFSGSVLRLSIAAVTIRDSIAQAYEAQQRMQVISASILANSSLCLPVSIEK